MAHEIMGVDVKKYAWLCQETSPKRWFGNMEMTSNCDVTNGEHQIQMTTIWPWIKPPHENFLRTPLCWPIVLNPTVSSQIGYLCRNWNARLLVLCIVEFIFKMAKRRADVALKHETYRVPPKFIQRAAAEQLNVILKNLTNNSRWIWKTKSIN